MGDSPQTGPPQPLESLFHPERLHLTARRHPLVCEKKKEERDRTTGSMEGSGTEDAAR